MVDLSTTLGGLASLCGVLLFLSAGTLGLRFLARFKQKTGLLLDDYIAGGAFIGFLGLNALAFYAISQHLYGYDAPKDKTVLDAEHPTLTRIAISLDAIVILTLGLVKLSAVIFFRRIFCAPGIWDAFKVISLIYIIVISAWTITFFVMTFRLCGNHGIEWDFAVGHSALCTLTYPYFKATSISDLILEVLVLGLPIPKIWTLNMIPSRKVGVTGVFLLAFVGLAGSIARCVQTFDSASHGTHVNVGGKIVNKSKDSYRTQTKGAYYMILEAGFTIIAINLPSLWYYTSGVSPQSVMRSVRSLVSLGSASRHNSQTNSFREVRTPRGGKSLDSNSAHSFKLGSTSTTVEVYSSGEIEQKKDFPGDGNGIRVDRDFRRMEDQMV